MIDFLDEERAKIDSLNKSYEKLIEEAEEETERLYPTEPQYPKGLERPQITDFATPIEIKEDGSSVYKSEDVLKYTEALTAYNAEVTKAYKAWEDKGGKEWKEAREKLKNLQREKHEVLEAYIKACEDRYYRDLGEDPEVVLADFKKKTDAIIVGYYTAVKEEAQRPEIYSMSDTMVRVKIDPGKEVGDEFYLDEAETMEHIQASMKRHLDILKATPKAYDEALSYIITALQKSPYVTNDESFILMGDFTAKKEYRTKAKADVTVDLYPPALIQPTLKGYQYSMSLYQDGEAFLQKITTAEGLRFEEGKIYFTGQIQEVSEAQLQNIKTKEGIENIDLPLLRCFYSLLLNKYEKQKKISDIETFFIPELAEYMGMRKNPGEAEVKTIIEKAQSFHNMLGIIKQTRNGKKRESYYTVLNFEYYDQEHNVIALSSQYINYLIKTIYTNSLRKDKKDKPKLKVDNTPLTLPSNSYLIKPEIITEKNKAAVENVFIIVTLIEQAGEHLPGIKTSTIVERNPQLQQRLEQVRDKNQLLNRTFKKTWELLKKMTWLTEAYKNIKLPDENNPKNIPTFKTLDKVKIVFPHDGKVKGWRDKI